MAIDPFIQAGSSMPNVDKDTMEHAFYQARSGLADTKAGVSAHRLAYYRRVLGVTTDDVNTLAYAFGLSGIKANRRNLIAGAHGLGTWGNQTPVYSTPSTTSYPATAAQDGGSAFQVVIGSGTLSGDGALRAAVPSIASASIVGGQKLYGAMDVYCPRAISAFLELNIYTAGNVDNFISGGVQALSVGWNRLVGVWTVPANPTGAFGTYQLLTTSGVTSGDTWLVSRAVLDPTGDRDYGSYFDGSSQGCTWDGATGLSSSRGYPGVAR